MASSLRLLTAPWAWLVDGTTEAVAAVLDRLRVRPVVRVDLDGIGGTVRGPDGAAVAQLVETGEGLRFDPPDAAGRLAGATVEVGCPPGWLFRRTLDPVAAEGAPFLDAFVRHQIERLTPWRAEDVDLCVHHAPLPGDLTRLAVEVGVVPHRLTAKAVAALRACGPAHLALVAQAAQEGPRFVMPIGDRSSERLRRLRSRVVAGLVIYLLAWPAALGWLWWSAAAVADEIAAADEVIEQRRSVLAAAARHDTAADPSGAALRRTRPRMVDLIEALSAALPDSAYATAVTIAGTDLKVSGVSTDPAALVPALEASGVFTDATFFDTTTRVENGGTGDRFHLEMQARPKPVSP